MISVLKPDVYGRYHILISCLQMFIAGSLESAIVIESWRGGGGAGVLTSWDMVELSLWYFYDKYACV